MADKENINEPIDLSMPFRKRALNDESCHVIRRTEADNTRANETGFGPVTQGALAAQVVTARQNAYFCVDKDRYQIMPLSHAVAFPTPTLFSPVPDTASATMEAVRQHSVALSDGGDSLQDCTEDHDGLRYGDAEFQGDDIRLAKSRTSFTSEQVANLEREYAIDRFANKCRKVTIAMQLGLTVKQVRNWFQNRRMKDKVIRQKQGHQASHEQKETNSKQRENVSFNSSIDSDGELTFAPPLPELLACVMCQKEFQHRKHLQEHMRGVHGERTFACPCCDYSATIAKYLRRHLAAKHKDYCEEAELMRQSYSKLKSNTSDDSLDKQS